MTAAAVVPFDPRAAKLPAVEAAMEKLDMGKFTRLEPAVFREIVCDWYRQERKAETMDGYTEGALNVIEAGAEFVSYNGVRYRRTKWRR